MIGGTWAGSSQDVTGVISFSTDEQFLRTLFVDCENSQKLPIQGRG